MNAQAKAYEDFLATQPTTDWTLDLGEETEEMIKKDKEVDMMDVYKELQYVSEGGGYVYLDNVDLKKLSITKQQFSGFCSALTKAGLYTPEGKAFGRVKS